MTDLSLPLCGRVHLLNVLTLDLQKLIDEILISHLLMAARFLITTYWKSEQIATKMCYKMFDTFY